MIEWFLKAIMTSKQKTCSGPQLKGYLNFILNDYLIITVILYKILLKVKGSYCRSFLYLEIDTG